MAERNWINVGYYIYKLDTLPKKYNRISDSTVAETRFEDVSPNEGNNYYMVRTLKLSIVASGSYYNLSQGIFDTIRYEPQKQIIISKIDSINNVGNEIQTSNYEETNVDAEIYPLASTNSEVSDVINETIIYPNPSTGLFNISFGSNPVRQATIKIYNLQGKLLRTEAFQNATLERFDIGPLPKGIYIVSGVIDGKNMSIKISLH